VTRLLHRHRADEALIPVATAHVVPAAHLGRRRDRDRRIGFADVAALPEPEWASSGHNAGRYTVAGLVPAGQLAAVPLRDPSADSQPIEALTDRAKEVMRCRDIAFVDDLAEDRKLSDARFTLHVAAAWVDEAAGFALAEDVQAIADAVAARPELRHNTALLMALAPIVAMLKEPLPVAVAQPENSHDARAAVFADLLFDESEA